MTSLFFFSKLINFGFTSLTLLTCWNVQLYIATYYFGLIIMKATIPFLMTPASKKPVCIVLILMEDIYAKPELLLLLL